jgi:hypothetical protein
MKCGLCGSAATQINTPTRTCWGPIKLYLPRVERYRCTGCREEFLTSHQARALDALRSAAKSQETK